MIKSFKGIAMIVFFYNNQIDYEILTTTTTRRTKKDGNDFSVLNINNVKINTWR